MKCFSVEAVAWYFATISLALANCFASDRLFSGGTSGLPSLMACRTAVS